MTVTFSQEEVITMGPNDPFNSVMDDTATDSRPRGGQRGSFTENAAPLSVSSSKIAGIGFVLGVGLAVFLMVFGFGKTLVVLLSGVTGSVIAIALGKMISGRLDVPAAWSALRRDMPRRRDF